MFLRRGYWGRKRYEKCVYCNANSFLWSSNGFCGVGPQSGFRPAGAPTTTSRSPSSKPRSPPSSAATSRTTATSLPTNSPTDSMNDSHRPPRTGDLGGAAGPASVRRSLPASRPRRTPSVRAERGCLAQHSDLRGEHRVVQQLHPLARARSPPTCRIGSPYAASVGRADSRAVVIPADEQRDVPGRDVVRSTADRRVEHGDRRRRRGQRGRRCAGCQWCARPAPNRLASAASSPPSRHASRTWSSVKTQITTTSAPTATSSSPVTAVAPSSAMAAHFSVDLPSTRTSWPASTRRAHHRGTHAARTDEPDAHRALLFAQALHRR